MRSCLLGFFMLTGCGSVEITPDPPRGSERPCVTSLGCPAGERCDDGKCAADVGCPGPSAPRVIYENPNDTTYPYIVSVNGREYLEAIDQSAAEPSSDLRFVDLATGVASILHHAPGYASCDGDPLRCSVEKASEASKVLTGLTLDASTQAWSAAVSHDLPAGYSPFFGSLPGGETILWGFGKTDLQRFNPATGESTSLLELGGRTPMRTVALPSGPVVTAYTHSFTDGTTASFAPLVPGAAWTTILATPEVVKNYWLAVPAGNAWFLVGDFLPSGVPQVWRVGPEGTKIAGSSDDPLLYEIANRYAVGDRALEGSVGKGLVCEGATCQSAHLDLATLERTPIGSLTIPGVTSSAVIQQRWLACDAVDATIQEPIVPPGNPAWKATGYRLRAVRVLPGATP
jgi:hypothetical protein